MGGVFLCVFVCFCVFLCVFVLVHDPKQSWDQSLYSLGWFQGQFPIQVGASLFGWHCSLFKNVVTLFKPPNRMMEMVGVCLVVLSPLI